MKRCLASNANVYKSSVVPQNVMDDVNTEDLQKLLQTENLPHDNNL